MAVGTVLRWVQPAPAISDLRQAPEVIRDRPACWRPVQSSSVISGAQPLPASLLKRSPICVDAGVTPDAAASKPGEPNIVMLSPYATCAGLGVIGGYLRLDNPAG